MTKAERGVTPALRRFATVDSTSDEARRLALAGEQGPLWIVADEQTKGRGRRGRSWISQRGNLFATLLLTDVPSLDRCAQLSFVAALAVGDTVAHFAPNAGIALKWPNDVLLDGRKAAGILLESSPHSGLGRHWIGVGIGVNLQHFPAGTEFPATSLAAVTGTAPSRDDAVNRLGAQWDRWFATWQDQGFPPVREAWLARAAGLGDKIWARSAETEIHGVFETLDSDGALILRTPDRKLTRITAGEVFFA